MRIAIGIDTGGTYTDAVALDYDSGQVLAKAKALTTRHDLSAGIGSSLEHLPGIDPQEVKLVSLSTTLATNAIVEGKGGRVCLLLLGYDPKLIKAFGFEHQFVTQDYIFIRGSFDIEGRELEPLDLDELGEAIRARTGQVDAFAISGCGSIKNPSHELQAKELTRKLSSVPVVCGHELAHELDSIKQATTLVLNARLLGLLKDLITSVQAVLRSRGIAAPLMIVKGDGSLMAAEAALERPVETILSGPAASAAGALYLSRESQAIAVDMGGTTTDIATLHEGQPRVAPEGARVGGWLTCVRAADIRTIGLGGDSYIDIGSGGAFSIGPSRVVPLCLAGTQHPKIIGELERAAHNHQLAISGVPATDFFFQIRPPDGLPLNPREEAILDRVSQGPVSMAELIRDVEYAYLYLRRPDRLEALGILGRIGLTPTDVLHAEGSYREWNLEAAQVGVAYLARRLELTTPEAIARVKDRIVDGLAREILAKLVSEETGRFVPSFSEGASAFILKNALDGLANSRLAFRLGLRAPIVAIGAPVGAYFPAVCAKLGAELIIPPHAEVANALGAVVGSVACNIVVTVTPKYEGMGLAGYVVYTPKERKEFPRLDEALEYGEKEGRALVEEEARRAGASGITIRVERADRRPFSASGESVYLDSTIYITAVGRPALAR